METIKTNIKKLFIGIDVHKKSWSISIRTDLAHHKTYTSPPSAEELFDYVQQHFRDYEVKVCYEAGCCGFWAARAFLNYGWQSIVVNPADVPRMDKQNYQKTDKIDSNNLSKQLQSDTLRAIYIPTEAEEQMRSLLRERNHIVKDLRRVKTHIKSMLLYHGIIVPDEYDNPNWSIAFKEWLDQLEWAHECGNKSMGHKLSRLQFLHQEYLAIGNELRAYARKHHKEDYYLLKSIPGIGGYLAAAILAECGDIRRFTNEKQFSSYVGMVPGMYNSGNKDTNLGITPRCKSLLRSYIIESAWVAYRKDPEIQDYYRKHIGKNPKSIIVKVGHKMVRRIYSIIKQGKPYQLNYSEKIEN